MTALDHDAIIVGAGPTGLLLAAELTRAGVDVALLERRSAARAGTRAIGVHPPVLAALEASGATERLLDGAIRIPRGLAMSRGRQLGEVRFDQLPLRFPFVASAPQTVTEAALAEGGPSPQRGMRVDALDVDGDRVRVSGTAESGVFHLQARVVVIAGGAGGGSLVPPTMTMAVHAYRDRYLMADVPASGAQPREVAVINVDRDGVLESFPLPGGGRRLVAWDRFLPRGAPYEGGWLSDDPDDLRRLREAVATRTGDEEVAAAVRQVSAFGVRRGTVRRMRQGRIFAIGDAAHEVSPIGGQGMNLGLLDAIHLAPLLATWAKTGTEPEYDLAQWERRRLASARTAARLAGLNTAVGRRRGRPAHVAATGILRVALGGPWARIPARAYAMGFDRDG